MRLSLLIPALACLIAGLLFGALNSAPLAINLYIAQFELSAGVALLAAAFLGAALAGFVLLLGVIWPMHRRLRMRERTTPGAVPSDP